MDSEEDLHNQAAFDPLIAENNRLSDENDRLTTELRHSEALLEAMKRSTSWRLTAPLRALSRSIGRLKASVGGKSRIPTSPLLPLNDENYAHWVQLIEANAPQRRRHFRNKLATLTARNLISLLMRVSDAPRSLLERSVESVRNQIYADWQLIIIDCGSTTPHMARTLATFSRDSRITILQLDHAVPRGAALRHALAASCGTLVGVLEPDDVLDNCTLVEILLLLSEQPQLQVIYTDEDRIDARGRRTAPRFKTDWNPDLLLTQPYIGGLTLYSRILVDRVDGFRNGFSGAEDYDLALRATGAVDPAAIGHIASVLLHRGGSFETVEGRAEACRLTVADHLRKEGIEVTTGPHVEAPVSHRVIWSQADATVSIIVPTRDRADLLRRCAKGVLASANTNLELLIVDNDSRQDTTIALLSELCADRRVRVMARNFPFNWSALNNEAACQTSGRVLAFLNNDVEAVENGWLEELVAQAMRPEIGAVGAKLLYRDGTVQHASICLGPRGYTRHLLRLAPAKDTGYLGQLVTARNVSAVTGACLAIRRDVFFSVGGFDEGLAVEYNDIDLCLRLWQKGYRVLFAPDARLYHLESATRGRGDYGDMRKMTSAAYDLLREKWGERLDRDPFLNPNIDLIGEEVLALRFPPRGP